MQRKIRNYIIIRVIAPIKPVFCIILLVPKRFFCSKFLFPIIRINITLIDIYFILHIILMLYYVLKTFQFLHLSEMSFTILFK